MNRHDPPNCRSSPVSLVLFCKTIMGLPVSADFFAEGGENYKRNLTQTRKVCIIGFMGVIFAILTIFVWENLQAEGGYTLKDLEILEEQGNHSDFFLHAKDIRPALRSEHWKRMVRHMAVGWVDFKLKRNIFDKDSYGAIEKIALWPTLRQDSFFRLKWGEYVLKGLERCFSGDGKEHATCRKRMERFWTRSEKMATVGYRLAELLMEKKRPGGWRYLSDVVTKEGGASYCGEKLVQEEFLKVVGATADAALAVERTLHPNCWKVMAPGLKKSLLESGHSKNGIRQERLFNILDAKGALAEGDKDFYFTLFILNGPKVGKTFNLAWSRMKVLGENYSRREKVLRRLRRLDPLPDAVVGTSHPDKRNTLLNFFSRHFPEYFNHYVKVCLNYLEGKGSFPQGNPTVRCREFFRYTDSLVSDKLYLRYSALKKEGAVVD